MYARTLSHKQTRKHINARKRAHTRARAHKHVYIHALAFCMYSFSQMYTCNNHIWAHVCNNRIWAHVYNNHIWAHVCNNHIWVHVCNNHIWAHVCNNIILTFLRQILDNPSRCYGYSWKCCEINTRWPSWSRLNQPCCRRCGEKVETTHATCRGTSCRCLFLLQLL